jgi:putative ABC transport system substrate-binding protein
MRRRQFITLLGGVAVAWPLAGRAQQAGMPVIGYLHPDTPQRMARLLASFLKGLDETGYVEGRNVMIEYRWGGGDNRRIPELVADLVRRQVAVIALPGSSAAAIAAKAATSTIPIVFSFGVDPVKLGIVQSLNRPGGNVTGVNSMSNELVGKRLELLRELLPNATRVAMLINPGNATAETQIEDGRAAAKALALGIEFFTASADHEIDTAFARGAQARIDALSVGPDSLFNNRRSQIAALAVRYKLPVLYPFRTDVEAGGLISYGTSLADVHRQVGVYTGRILNGEKPADLPVLQPTKFELVINLKTAKVLGLDVPPTLIARADEVIE